MNEIVDLTTDDPDVEAKIDTEKSLVMKLQNTILERKRKNLSFCPSLELQNLAHSVLQQMKDKYDIINMNYLDAKNRKYPAFYLFMPQQRKSGKSLETHYRMAPRVVTKKAQAIAIAIAGDQNYT